MKPLPCFYYFLAFTPLPSFQIPLPIPYFTFFSPFFHFSISPFFLTRLSSFVNSLEFLDLIPGMRLALLFTTFLWQITVSGLLFAFSGALAAPTLKPQDFSNRTYPLYQISDGIGGTAEVEAGAMISGTSLFSRLSVTLLRTSWFVACTWLRRTIKILSKSINQSS